MMPPAPTSRSAAPWLLAGASLLLGTLWAVVGRPFDAPDEPSHLNAVIQVIATGRPPLATFRFDRDPMGEIASPPFDPALDRVARSYGVADDLKRTSYESMQTPLYYVAAAAAGRGWANDPAGLLTVARLVSAVFGAGTVLGCWSAVRRLAPDEPAWAWAAAGTVALIPQFQFNAATAANDAAVNCGFAWAFASWFRSLRDPADDPWMIRSGGIVGLAILAKLSGLALVPGLALLVLFRAGQVAETAGRGRRLARMAFGAFGAVGLLAGWWFARNALVLGDPTGAGDPARYFRARFVPFQIRSIDDATGFLALTWQSFWGRFGWMNRPLPAWSYTVTLVAAAGLAAITLARWARRPRPPLPILEAVALMAITTAGVLAVFVQINLTHGFQAQGRYLFPVAVPIALVLTGGVAASGPHSRARRALLGLFWAWLAVLQILGLSGLGG